MKKPQQEHGLSHHPSEQRDRVSLWKLGFGVFGGPLAWFAQQNLNFGLFSTPCFPGPDRNIHLLAEADWVWPAGLVVYLACLVVALVAAFVSWSMLQKTRDESHGGRDALLEAGNGRTRFAAMWGVLLGGGFAVVIFVNLLAIFLVPPCAL